MPTRRLRHLLATFLVLALAATMSLPAFADDDDDDREAEARTERLEFELNPAIADVGETVELEVEVEDESDDDGDDESDDSDDAESDDTDGSDSTDDTDADGSDSTNDTDTDGSDSTDDTDTGTDADTDTSDTDDESADADGSDSTDDDSTDDEPTTTTAALTEVTVDWGDGTVETLTNGTAAPADGTTSTDEAATPDDTAPADGTAMDEAVTGFAQTDETDDESDDGDESDEDGDESDDDGDEDDNEEIEGEHVYEAEGDYTVAVTATFADGTTESATLLVQVGGGEARISGDSRHETAIEVSEEEFGDDEASAVLLARADAFADALAAAPLAFDSDAPILLTDTADVPQAVIDEIERVLVDGGTVYLLGGEAAITPAVADTLTALGFEVIRIAGDDRIDTALQIARFLIDADVDIDEVILASADSFPDALAGAAHAARSENPILLTGRDALDPRVRDLLVELGDVEVLVPGGEATVSEAVLDEVRALGLEVERISGDDRFETSAEIAEALFEDVDTIIIATGNDFPDALAAGAQAGRESAPILLVGNELPQAVADYIAANADTITTVYVLGGVGAVPGEVMDAIRALLAA